MKNDRYEDSLANLNQEGRETLAVAGETIATAFWFTHEAMKHLIEAAFIYMTLLGGFICKLLLRSVS